MCNIRCPNCGHNVEAVKKQQHVFAGFLKADLEKNPAIVGGVCPKCKQQYTVVNPPAITLCAIGDTAYNYRIQKIEEGIQLRNMNKPFIDRVNSGKSVLKVRKVA